MSFARTLIPAALLLLSLNPAGAHPLHPLLRAWVENETAQKAPAPFRIERTEADGAERIAVWVRTSDQGSSLEGMGLLSTGHRSDLRSARWTREQLQAALLNPCVVSISPAVRCRPLLDVSVPETSTDIVHEANGNPPTYIGLTGEGIIVGIVDSGIDLAHADFLEGGNTRLISVWDQTVASADPPRNFAYGKEWLASQIDGGLSTEVDTDGHGTHVAGIAAGNGAATGNGEPAYTYVGAAPKASIVFVKTDYLTTSVADGVDYIFQKADSLGLPAVVNLSLGTHYGPHDGTSDFAASIDALTGPGHLVVAAAGNENGDAIHAERTVSVPDSATISFLVPSYTRHPLAENDEIDLTGWYTGGTNLAITIVTPTGMRVGPVAKGTSGAASTTDGRVEIDNAAWASSNGDHEVYVRIYDQNASDPPAEGTWLIRLYAVSGGASEFDVWNFYSTMAEVGFLQGLDEAETVGCPATADSVIAVASYITKGSWTAVNGITYGYDPPVTVGAISSFSSKGPRRDGAAKPNIAAPGQGIGSARSTAASYGTSWILEDGVHVITQGTSMASPHVAGIVALMLEQLGPLSQKAIMQRLVTSARIDAFTGGTPNSTWGAGKIDALDATGYVVPVQWLSASATQVGDHVEVRFLLGSEVGEDPLPIWREGPNDATREPIGFTTRGQERLYLDDSIEGVGLYRYWLRLEDRDGVSWIGPAEIEFQPLTRFDLQVHPNPFLGATRIDWAVANSMARIEIFDVSGRRIRSVEILGDETSGTFDWDGLDDQEHPVPAGLYLVRLRAKDGEKLTRKLLHLE